MGMFKRFTKIDYSLDKINASIVNIGISLIVDKIKNVEQLNAFNKLIIKDGESPESISERVYGNADHYWTILLVNNIIDPFTEWPMDSEIIMEYVIQKYTDINGIHHYENVSDKVWCDLVESELYNSNPELKPDSIQSVTNYLYEFEQNELKRNILIVNPRFIKQFINTFNTSLENRK